MKKLFPIVMMLLLAVPAMAQITLDKTYSYSGAFTHLSLSGDKFYVMDVPLSQCRIYNTDHTLWKTLPLTVPTNNWLYDVQYISENLFTTDNSLCLVYTYYSYDATNLYYTYTTRVVKENGTMLLSLPGCQYYYLAALTSGATKFVTYSFDYSVSPYTVSTSVYSVPGSLPTSIKESSGIPDAFPLRLFPNPAVDQVSMQWEIPAEVDAGILQITDLQGKVVKSFAVSGNNGFVQMNVSHLPKGMYLYQIKAGSFHSEPMKMIVN